MPGHRMKKIQSLLTQEIAKLLRDEVKDPRITGIYSITQIKVAKDLKTALVFMSIMGDDEEKNKILEGLNSCSNFIQRRLWKILTIKQIPDLKFKLDESVEKGINLYYKLQEMEKREKEMGWHQDDNAHEENG